MSTDVRVEVVIARPRAQVAAFMFDPANDARWTSGVVAVRPLDEGRLRTGSRVERTARFLGREFSYQYQVVEARGDELVEMTVKEPFPMRVRYQLDELAGGTRATIHAQGNAGGFFVIGQAPRQGLGAAASPRYARLAEKLAAPLLNLMVRRSIGKDLRQLKQCLE